ncbi:metallophosphoesterase [Romboutsia maritimum]|uniref:Phosphoesterase n=1 Tax=Romboutsia maritimum TaxID=2020948 RepID=A0A371IVD9_9FIRM|nr:metallophosphoesterase [Romboutsia maritimum]RDY24453.1 metallophosphoesterase [Romboutsia maritimum]
MKIGVLSDTHNAKVYIDKVIPYLEECDLIIHAGDNFSDSKYIHNMTNIDIMAVKGNCDFDNVEEELFFEVEGKNIFLCHGDTYDIKYGMGTIESRAKKIGADIVVFGHTHMPTNIEKDGILYINPGSLALPRGVDYRSFLILNIEKEKINLEEVRI